MVKDALLILPNIVNQDTTHDLTYTTKIMSEFYYINELPNGTFPLLLKLIYHYWREHTFLFEKPKYATYQKGSFRGGRNTIELVTYRIIYTRSTESPRHT